MLSHFHRKEKEPSSIAMTQPAAYIRFITTSLNIHLKPSLQLHLKPKFSIPVSFLLTETSHKETYLRHGTTTTPNPLPHSPSLEAENPQLPSLPLPPQPPKTRTPPPPRRNPHPRPPLQTLKKAQHPPPLRPPQHNLPHAPRARGSLSTTATALYQRERPQCFLRGVLWRYGGLAG